MKRYGNLFEQVVEFGNLIASALEVCCGHKSNPAAASLYFHMETEALKLQEELMSGTYQPRPYKTFEIYEPKKRLICAADVRDRVVHHAICRVLDPIFDPRLINDTYACRVGKGTHAAVRRSQEFARKHSYFLKCDIRKYFPSIDHAILKSVLRGKIKDERLLALLDLIIDQKLPYETPGKGLPIGNLTSQHFANLYLGELDHYIKERLRVKGYLRYMDDFIIFADEKESLHLTLASARGFLRDCLRLEIKEEALILAPVTQGIPFLGFRVFPGLIKLDARKWTRFKRKVRELEDEYLKGRIDEDELARSISSMVGHIQHADTLAARRKFFERSLNLG